jgi:hypothetical protein
MKIGSPTICESTPAEATRLRITSLSVPDQLGVVDRQSRMASVPGIVHAGSLSSTKCSASACVIGTGVLPANAPPAPPPTSRARPATAVAARDPKTMSTEPKQRRARADATRNRSQILQAAAQAFEEEGLEVSMDSIAKRSGEVATLRGRCTRSCGRVGPCREDKYGEVGARVQGERPLWVGSRPFRQQARP